MGNKVASTLNLVGDRWFKLLFGDWSRSSTFQAVHVVMCMCTVTVQVFFPGSLH